MVGLSHGGGMFWTGDELSDSAQLHLESQLLGESKRSGYHHSELSSQLLGKGIHKNMQTCLIHHNQFSFRCQTEAEKLF